MNSVDNDIFDLCVRVLNYSIEFAHTGGYASLRLLDVLNGLLGVANQLEGLPRREFYLKAKNEIEKRVSASGYIVDEAERSKFINDLLDDFLEEWKKSS